MQVGGDPLSTSEFRLAKSEESGTSGPGAPAGAFKHPLRHLNLLFTAGIGGDLREFSSSHGPPGSMMEAEATGETGNRISGPVAAGLTMSQRIPDAWI